MRQAVPAGGQLVGREAELAVLRELLGPGDAPRGLVVMGEAGIGKTTIVGAALDAAAALSLRALVARPAAPEIDLPYAGLGDLFDSVDARELGGLAHAPRVALETALARRRPGGVIDKHALARGVLELLRQMAVESDLLVVVDDVQWLDRPTVAVLTFAVRRLEGVPLRLLAATRVEEGTAELPFGLGQWKGVRRLEIGPMSATELGALVRRHLGVQMTRPQSEQLQAASGGNPMFALELVRSGGKAIRNLPQALAERLLELEPSQRATLALAAAALRPTVALLSRSGIARAALTAVLRTGIVEVEGDRLRFVHPLLASAAYELLLEEERREAHARLAAASIDPVERGHHLDRSVTGPDERAARAVESAADESARLGDHAGAAAFLVRAAELERDSFSDVAVSRRLRAVAELELAGDVEGGTQLASGLLERLPPGPAWARARLRLASLTAGPTASFPVLIGELESALEEADGDERLLAELHLFLSELACLCGRLSAAVEHAGAAISLAERSGAEEIVVGALAMRGFAESMVYGGVPESSREAFTRWDRTTMMMPASPRMELACVCLAAGEFAEAEMLFVEELEVACDLGLEPIEVVARAHLAETQLRAGRWSEASANARLALEHARQAAEPQIVTALTCVVATTDAAVGHHDEARTLAVAVLAEAEASGDFWWTTWARAVLGLLALTEGDTAASVEVLEPAWRLMLERGLGDLSLFPVGHVLAEALVGTGRLEEALGVAAALRACPVGERAWCRAMASRCEALVLSARGEHDAARSMLAAALEAHADLAEPFEHARTVHLAGRVEHAARNWGAARRALTEALERFDLLGAARWADRVTADLARLPGRRPENAHLLSAREREVAELVAGGLTNKEVAARLFVSLRTVEASLSKVYAKLGIRSRTELAVRSTAGFTPADGAAESVRFPTLEGLMTDS